MKQSEGFRRGTFCKMPDSTLLIGVVISKQERLRCCRSGDQGDRTAGVTRCPGWAPGAGGGAGEKRRVLRYQHGLSLWQTQQTEHNGCQPAQGSPGRRGGFCTLQPKLLLKPMERKTTNERSRPPGLSVGENSCTLPK